MTVPTHYVTNLILFDFLLVTTTLEEHQAVVDKFGIDTSQPAERSGDVVFRRARLSRPGGGDYEIALIRLSDQASDAAAVESLLALKELDASYAVLVGIAGAAKRMRRSESLGNVIVGTNVYDNRRAKHKPRERVPEPYMYPGSPDLRKEIAQLGPWKPALVTPRPGGGTAVPKMQEKVIVVSDAVVASATKRDELALGHRKVGAIEMEGSGFSLAALHRGKQSLVVKALVDRSNRTKDDEWHGYGAEAAADFVYFLLTQCTIPPRNSLSSRGIFPPGGALPSLTDLAVDQEAIPSSAPLNSQRLRSSSETAVSLLLPEVLVEREFISRLVVPRLESAEGACVFIVGQAGFGKSTALGQLGRLLLQTRVEPLYVVFCQSLTGDLSTASGFGAAVAAALGDGAGQPDDVWEALNNTPAIFLFDTLDVILDGRNASDIAKFLKSMVSRGHRVVVSCRDYDFAEHLSFVNEEPGTLVAEPVFVPGFTDAEASFVAAGRFKRQHPHVTDEQARAFASSLLNIKANRSPLPLIATSPLLLGMACEIFNQRGVPEDLTVAQLYETYWEKKVLRPRRRGGRSLYRESLSQTLSQLCYERSKLAKRLVEDALPQEFLSGDDAFAEVERLLSEGVLERTRSGGVRFFHQTLLEYGIARWAVTSGDAALNEMVADFHTGSAPAYAAGIIRQCLAIAEKSLYESMVEDLDEGDFEHFRLVAWGAASRPEPEQLIECANRSLQLSAAHQRFVLNRLLEAPHPMSKLWPALLRIASQGCDEVREAASQKVVSILHLLPEPLGRYIGPFIAISWKRGELRPGQPLPEASAIRLGWLLSGIRPRIAHMVDPEMSSALQELDTHLKEEGRAIVASYFALEGVPVGEVVQYARSALTVDVPRKSLQPLVAPWCSILHRLINEGAMPWRRWSELPHLELLPRWQIIFGTILADRADSEVKDSLVCELGSGKNAGLAEVAFRRLIERRSPELLEWLLKRIPESAEGRGRLGSLLLALLWQDGKPTDRGQLGRLREIARAIGPPKGSKIEGLLDADASFHDFREVIRTGRLNLDQRQMLVQLRSEEPDRLSQMALDTIAALQGGFLVVTDGVIDLLEAAVPLVPSALDELVKFAQSHRQSIAARAANAILNSKSGDQIPQRRLETLVQSPHEYVSRLATQLLMARPGRTAEDYEAVIQLCIAHPKTACKERALDVLLTWINHSDKAAMPSEFAISTCRSVLEHQYNARSVNGSLKAVYRCFERATDTQANLLRLFTAELFERIATSRVNLMQALLADVLTAAFRSDPSFAQKLVDMCDEIHQAGRGLLVEASFPLALALQRVPQVEKLVPLIRKREWLADRARASLKAL